MFLTGESHCMPSRITYTVLHNPQLLLVNSATTEDAWWLVVLHLSCLPPGGRQLCPFNSWPMGQCVWNMSGVFGHLGVGAGRERSKKKKTTVSVEAVMLQEMWSMLFPGLSRSLVELGYTQPQRSETAPRC